MEEMVIQRQMVTLWQGRLEGLLATSLAGGVAGAETLLGDVGFEC